MKTILFLLLFVCESVFCQTWVSDYCISYKDIGGEWVRDSQEFENNTFVVCRGDLVWVSDRIVKYTIIDIEENQEETTYIVRGIEDHILTFNVRKSDVRLLFKALDGEFYAIHFNLASEFKKY